MKKVFIKVLSVMLVVVITLTAAPLSGFVGLELPEWLDFSIESSAATSGDCGDNLTWNFDESTGTLTIDGEGDMQDWDTSNTYAPWFSLRKSIVSIVIKKGVTSIGVRAFYDCTSLISVILSDSVTSIGEWAFSECTGLKNITLPHNIESIAWGVFHKCSSLRNIIIPNSATLISTAAFAYCTSLTNITIPDSITSIGSSAFSECTNLSNVTIGSSVTSIGEKAFYNCTKLENITFPDSVTSIGKSAFRGCIGLTTVIIPNSVTSIGYYAFEGCTNLRDITIGSGVKSIYNLFNNCTNLTNFIVDNGNQYYSNDEYGVLFNKEKTSIMIYPCNKKITSYTIPNTVKTIASYAFSYCNNLNEVIISDSVTTISDYAFWYSTSIKNVTMSNNTYKIGDGAFTGLSSLESIRIPKTVKKLGMNLLFEGCNSLTKIIVDEENTIWSSDDNGVLYNKSKTTLLRYPAGNKATSFVIPESVESILGGNFQQAAFSGAHNLKTIYISNNITFINHHTFRDLYNLESVVFGSSINTIGISAFSGCKGLKNIVLPSKLETIYEDAFFECINLESVTISECTKEISSRAFKQCVSLKDVYYLGTEVQWNNILIQAENEPLLNATIHFNTNDKQYYIYGRLFNENIDYYTAYWDSSKYNVELANMLAALSKAVYSQDDIFEACKSLEFTEYGVYDFTSNYDTSTCGYSLAFKKSDYNDEYICLVSVRGSKSLDYNADWISNFEIFTDENGEHIGFSNPAKNILNEIQLWQLNNQISNNVKYVITGHSRGAAVANLLAVNLMRNGVSSRNIYNYNFGCPDVACKVDFPEYNNIFNLCNRLDVVTYIPGLPASVFTTPLNSWGKYGQTKRFTLDAYDEINQFANHSMNLYLEFFDQQLNPNGTSEWDEFWDGTNRFVGYIAKILCPVDVIVTDQKGNKIASVINGEINYYDSNLGDVIILTDGDKKAIYINGENNFNVQLIGTDSGTMTYSVEKCNLASGETYESKTFDDVVLEKGKTMYSPVSEAEATNDIQLFVTEEKDGEKVYTNIINEDGTEEKYYNYTFTIQTPSRTEIRHKDGIKLHANIEGTAPDGCYVEWTASNGKFKTEEINDGNSLKIISDSNGKTTFTAILYDADGNELARDSIEMKSKAGFFDKIGSFFRLLFGDPTIHEK